MIERLVNVYTQLTAPPPLALIVYMLSLYCLLTAFGVVKGFEFGKLALPAPTTRKGTILVATVGVLLLAFGAVLSVSLLPDYKPTVSEELIYAGNDAHQIVADGEDVYLLKTNGSIFRIAKHRLELIVDTSRMSRGEPKAVQIAPAGGVIYIRNDIGNVLAYQWVVDRTNLKLTDDGTGTKQIVSVGEMLYILKNNGNIWKHYTTIDGQGRILDNFDMIDDGTGTREISCSGALLYVLKNNGNIWQYSPVAKGASPYEEIYKGGDATHIKADGGALYFTKQNGSVWKYKNGLQQIDIDKHTAKSIDALHGVIYILTMRNTIWRYNSQKGNSREIGKAGSDNEEIAAYGPDLFVIKTNGSVWRYNEGLLRR
jgi:hypothetical protein